MRAFVEANDVRSLDESTLKKLRINSFELMQKVAKEMAETFEQNSILEAGRVLVICGPGNNGGDGYCLAEYLRKRGRDVSVFVVHPPQSQDCKSAEKFYKGSYTKEIFKAPIIVDALYGSSGRSKLEDREIQILKKVNAMNGYRIAVDVPTGIDVAKRTVHSESFRADLSFVVGWPKTAFIDESIAEFLGQIHFIGDYFSQPSTPKYLALENIDFKLPRRKQTGFKGDYGRCGVVGGSASMPGAAILAAEAAHRFGAGYATIYFAKAGGLKISVRDASFLLKTKWKSEDLKKESALVLGCGGFLKKFAWSSQTAPLVVDADALEDLKGMRSFKGRAILTPHLGEAAKLLKIKTSEVKADRTGALDRLCEMTKQSVYLKGAPGFLKFQNPSVRSHDNDNLTYVNLSINPAFSKAGSGDILSGILGGSLAQVGDGVTEPSQKLGDGVEISGGFERAIISGLVFQSQVGEILRMKEASIATDQLEVFSEAFKRLRS
jgi:NAD(P)H-hydrate epimerase